MKTAIEKSDFEAVGRALKDDFRGIITKEEILLAVEIGNLGILSLLFDFKNVEISETFKELEPDVDIKIIKVFLDNYKLKISTPTVNLIIKDNRVDIIELLLKDRRFTNIEFPEEWLSSAIELEDDTIFKLLWNDKRFEESKTSSMVINRIIMLNEIKFLKFMFLDATFVKNLTANTIPFYLIINKGTSEMFDEFVNHVKPSIDDMKTTLLRGKEEFFKRVLGLATELELKILLASCLQRQLFDKVDAILGLGIVNINSSILIIAVESKQLESLQYLLENWNIAPCDGNTCVPYHALNKKDDEDGKRIRDAMAYELFRRNNIKCKHRRDCLRSCIIYNLPITGTFLLTRVVELDQLLVPYILQCDNLEFIAALLQKVKSVDHKIILGCIKTKDHTLLASICQNTDVDLKWNKNMLIKTCVKDENDIALNILIDSRRK